MGRIMYDERSWGRRTTYKQESQMTMNWTEDAVVVVNQWMRVMNAKLRITHIEQLMGWLKSINLHRLIVPPGRQPGRWPTCRAWWGLHIGIKARVDNLRPHAIRMLLVSVSKLLYWVMKVMYPGGGVFIERSSGQSITLALPLSTFFRVTIALVSVSGS